MDLRRIKPIGFYLVEPNYERGRVEREYPPTAVIFLKTAVAPSCPTHFVEFELRFLMVQKYFKVYFEKWDITGFYED